MNTLLDPKVKQTLARLHAASRRELPQILRGALRGVLRRRLQPADMVNAYIAISPRQGQLLYTLARAIKACTIVEYGTSFGISAIYLGAAAKDNGGRVFTAEIEPHKVQVARKNLSDAGLSEMVTVLEGNALETLIDVPTPIDLLFMDGWTDLYVALIERLEPKFRAGLLIVADNADFPGTQPFLRYLRQRPQKYVTQTLRLDKGGTEVATYLGGRQ